MSTLRVVCASAIVFLTAHQAISKPSDWSIQPGKSIGKIEVGTERNNVATLLGKPAGSYPLEGGLVAEYWSSGVSTNTVRIFYKSDKVVQISVTSSKFKLPSGLTTDNDPSVVRKAFPKGKSANYSGSHGSSVSYYDLIDQGLAFEFTLEEGRPRTYAIIVHGVGSPVIPDADEEESD